MTAALLILAAIFCQTKLSFEKVFPKSDPPYVAIEISGNGAAVFKTDPKDEQPVIFQLTPAETEKLFGLAGRVDFARPLESTARVAFMGTKTIRYEHGGQAGEQKWNYTENADAQALADYFENILETEQAYLLLERTAKYEKVGVNDALLDLQVTWEKKRLIAAQQFLPLLDRIAKGESYMTMARKRAASLAATFRAEAPAAKSSDTP